MKSETKPQNKKEIIVQAFFLEYIGKEMQ